MTYHAATDVTHLQFTATNSTATVADGKINGVDISSDTVTFTQKIADEIKITGNAGGYKFNVSAGDMKFSGTSGNDEITLTDAATNALITFDASGGNGIVHSFGEDDTIKITGGTYKRTTSGDDLILTVGNGKITLEGAANLTVNIDGTIYTPSSSGGSSTKPTTTPTTTPSTELTTTPSIVSTLTETTPTGTDIIFAGDGGSQLWGSEGNIADTLVGGNGVDNFIYGMNQGLDNFVNVSSEDALHLLDVNLSDIVGTLEVNDNTIAIGFSTGNIIMI